MDSGITESTLWMRDDDTLRVWIALLSKCDAGGYARVAAPAMAHICRMVKTDGTPDVERFERVIDGLCAPDQYSRCSDNEGRRVAVVEGGYVVLSYEKYRDMKTRAQTPAERKQAQRERERASDLVRDVTPTVTESHDLHESHDVTPDEKQKQIADTDEKGIRAKTDSRVSGFEEFWKVYPKKRGKRDAEKAWKQTAKERPENGAIVQAVQDQTGWESWKKSGGQFIPYPASWLRAGCWQDEPDAPSMGLEDDMAKLYRGMKIRGEI